MSLHRIDLHIHTPASNCFSGPADPVRSAQLIIGNARKRGLSLIAVTDHHSSRGIEAVRREGERAGIKVLPGMELTCRIGDVDEVFLLTIFPERFSPAEMERMLLSWGIASASFGEGGAVVPAAVGCIVSDVRAAGGIVISARADKTPFRRGAIPALLSCGVRLFDVVFPESAGSFFPAAEPCSFLTFSDAHSPEGVGSRFTECALARPSFEEFIDKIGKMSYNLADMPSVRRKERREP